ncbi:MAG: penicillin-binding protein, partial [Syntrophomonadaceae bacterium]|nr:penicillin-binding protein [Syntrophomonadaceae bacterium]
DAWFVGFTPDLCCAVWVGYDADKTADLTGSSAAGPIWAEFMRQATAGLPEKDFVKPLNVEIINVCLDSGMIAAEGCTRTSPMAFVKGSEPDDICYLHSNERQLMLNDETNLPDEVE